MDGEHDDYTPKYTPVEYAYTDTEPRHRVLLKRDDLYRMAGICGGKVRACWHLATAGQPPRGGRGLVTASARKSPQAQIVARLAQRLGVAARLHMPKGAMTPEMEDMVAHGGELVQWPAGYNNVICKRATDDAAASNLVYIPFGMECREALLCTKEQVASLEPYRTEISRIVVPVGSGMSAAGLLWGLQDLRWTVPVLGVRVGADPTKRLDRHAPPFWRQQMKIVDVTPMIPYDQEVTATVGGIRLDPIYEAKCARFLRERDLFWIVGIRAV